jgi:hypothetical protein
MTKREEIGRWILSHCDESGGTVHITFAKKDLPPGVSIGLTKSVFGALKRANLIEGGIAVSDNAGCLMKLKCLK